MRRTIALVREPSKRVTRFVAVVAIAALVACGGPAQGDPNLPALKTASVSATSSTTVIVQFNQRVAAGAASAANYRIVDDANATLKVIAAYPLAGGDRVALATEPQRSVPYQLSTSGIARGSDGWAGTPTAAAGFAGSTAAAPVVDRVVPLSATKLLVTLADAATRAPVAMSDQALLPDSYRALTDGLSITAAEFDGGTDRSQVILTTSPMPAGRQRLELAGVTTLVNESLVDPLRSGADFYGLTANDQTPPFVVDAYAADATTIVLWFSEPVTSSAGANAVSTSDFALVGAYGQPVAVNAVASEQHGTRLRLSVTGLTAGQVYRLTLTGLRDTAANPLGGVPSTVLEVVGPTASGAPDDVAPRVTGAVSTGPNGVLVTFSEPMAGGVGSAENPQHYAIIGDTASGQVAAQAVVTVTGAALAPNGRSVALTTLAQSDIVYHLTVVNVADLAGNLVVPPDREQPHQVTFVGTPTSGGGADTDGDGLSDAAEQRGWTVVVRRADGTVSTATVTSDPLLADTDDDGLGDKDERTYLTNPRSADTDADDLTDVWELTYVYSDPTHQDSDDDGLIDGLEWWFFRTSPNLDDTDGDQILDGDEINFGNRNPRLADLPLPGIEVGAVDLQLDVRFSATSQRGTRELESASYSSTLTQSESRSTSNTDSNTQEFMIKAAVEVAWSAKIDFGASGKFKAETGYTGQWTSSFTQESARETQNSYERSTQTDLELQVDESLSRSVEGAAMRLTVSLRNLGDIAFTMSDVQVSAFMLDPAFPGRLIPIATLTPEAEPAGGYNLGPLVPERGPLVFVNDQVFPALVEQLMRNPAGLVFKISNFDITDEFGRNFAFTSQDVNDRTATVVIDYGAVDSDNDGEGDITERLKVSTSAGRATFDADGDGDIDDDDRILFDDRGRQVGITLAEALEDVLGLEHYDEDQRPTSSLNPVQVANSYSTRVVNGVERLWRIRTASRELGNPLKAWAVLTPDGIVDNTAQDVRSRVLGAGEGITLAFVQDLDDDGLPASIEYMHGCSDVLTDTDNDTLTDRFELFEGWPVFVIGKGDYVGYSSCARTDTDRDGIGDATEFQTHGTDAQRPDTDGDGLSDTVEINGFSVDLRFTGGTVTVQTDPLNPDSDGDTLNDGAERDLGVNPTVNDGDQVFDDDGDGLVNALEDLGWSVTIFSVSTTPHVQPAAQTVVYTSNKALADTDGDGVRDDVEYQRRTNPNAADTDADGLSDALEQQLGTNPRDADTDNDLLTDGAEVNTARRVEVPGKAPYEVFTDPLVADADLDLLVDGQEVPFGTDPTMHDTDEDGASDKVEIDRLTDLNPNNDTRPTIRDQLLVITYEIQGVRTTFNNICGEAGMGNAYVTGDFFYNLAGITNGGHYTTGGNNLGTDYILVYSHMRVLTAAPGASIQAFTTNLTRWDGAIGFTLQNVNQTFTTGNGLFDSIKSEVFRQVQAAANPEDCVINVRFTITPLNN